MCPISASLQFLIVIFTLLLVCHAVVVKSLMSISFNPKNVTVLMYDTATVDYNVTAIVDNTECILYSENPDIAYLEKPIILKNLYQHGSFNISGSFLGQTVISCKDNTTNLKVTEDKLDVKCLRKQRIIDRIFTGSTATLVAIIYINFGCVVQWAELRNIIRKPVGPAIGFCGQFIMMPLLSYGIGYVLFPNDPAMRLGMFFTGVSPAGGASNIWTAILDGNIDLSILMTTISTIAAFGMMPLWLFTLGKTIFKDAALEMDGNIDLSILMTTISTIAAFGMMPLWLFTLGKTIFKDAALEVPYTHISTYVFALLVPLAIGYLINRYFKKTGAFLGRILKGFSSVLILFIIIFAIVTNLYLFQLFSWRIIVAGMGLPWLGYMLGYIMAIVFKQPAPDALAIAIETGIQNTGIAIFLLRFALEPLHADLTTVVPVSVAIMTPFPLTFIYLYKKIKLRFWGLPEKSDINELCPKSRSPNNNYRHSHARQDSAVACLS